MRNGTAFLAMTKFFKHLIYYLAALIFTLLWMAGTCCIAIFCIPMTLAELLSTKESKATVLFLSVFEFYQDLVFVLKGWRDDEPANI